MLQLIHQRCHFDKGIRRGYIVHEIVICIESLMPVIATEGQQVFKIDPLK